MLYYTQEIQDEDGVSMTAGVKARADIESILASEGGQAIRLAIPAGERKDWGSLKRIHFHKELRDIWENATEGLKEGDTLIIQFPVINHSVFMAGVIRSLRKRGVRVALLLHDLESFRWAKKKGVTMKRRIRLRIEELSVLQAADYVIAHNKEMIRSLSALGCPSSKCISLGIFDYLMEDTAAVETLRQNTGREEGVIIAGALREHKAGYAYQLQGLGKYQLYGIGYEGRTDENVQYFGAFPPEELPAAMNGSFGLVWDGEATETCEGTYGEYLRINNPHKTSLYLAAGLPVIIWNEAALAPLIEKQHCGFTVSSLQEIPERIRRMSDADYEEMKKNAAVMAKRLRGGRYTRRVLQKIEES